MLDGVVDRDAELAVSQGCWIECLTGILVYVADRDGAKGVRLGLLDGVFECSLRALEWVLDKDAVIQGLRGMLDRVYDRDARMSVFQGCWIKCLTGTLGGVFHSHYCIMAYLTDAALSV